MRFTLTAAFLALATSVFAQTSGFDVISKPTRDEVVPAGTTYEITWAPNSNWTGTVTIGLIGGASQGSQQDLGTLATGIDTAAGKYDWAVAQTLGTDKVYGLSITLDSDKSIFQYSNPFAIKAVEGAGSSSSSSSTSTAHGSTSTSTSISFSTSTSHSSGSSSSSGSSASTASVTSTESSTSESTAVTSAASVATGSLAPTNSIVTVTTSGAASTATHTPSTVSANPASAVRASAIALFGGLAVAFFAL